MRTLSWPSIARSVLLVASLLAVSPTLGAPEATKEASDEPTLVPEKISNRSRYGVYVAFGCCVEKSGAKTESASPEFGLFTSYWHELPPGQSIVIPDDFFGYVRVVADVQGKPYEIKPESRARPVYMPMPRAEGTDGELHAKCGIKDTRAARRIIQEAGHRSGKFLPLTAFQTDPNGPYVVLASAKSIADLERRLGYRKMALLSISNGCEKPVTFAFRWRSDEEWTKQVLLPRKHGLYWHSFAHVRPQVSFDEGLIAGNQNLTVSLRQFEATVQGSARPSVAQAFQYRFVASGNRLRIHER